MRHVERRHHFLRDHVEKGDIEMRYIDTERQLDDIFTKPLDSSRFADLRGGLMFVIHMAWFEGELVILTCILYILLFSSQSVLSVYAARVRILVISFLRTVLELSSIFGLLAPGTRLRI
jgi:hypothetical protein